MLFKDKVITVENRKTTFVGRELALLSLLSQGETPKTIADGAEVPVQTVYSQLRTVLIKLRVRSYKLALRKARKLGLVEQV